MCCTYSSYRSLLCLRMLLSGVELHHCRISRLVTLSCHFTPRILCRQRKLFVYVFIYACVLQMPPPVCPWSCCRTPGMRRVNTHYLAYSTTHAHQWAPDYSDVTSYNHQAVRHAQSRTVTYMVVKVRHS